MNQLSATLTGTFNAPRLSVRHQGVKPRYNRLRPKGIRPRFGYRFRRRYPKPKR